MVASPIQVGHRATTRESAGTSVVAGSRDEARERCGTDREGGGAIAHGMLGAGDARRRAGGGGSRWFVCLFFRGRCDSGGDPVDGGWHEMQSLDGVAGRRAIPGDGGEGSRRGTFSTAKKKIYIYIYMTDWMTHKRFWRLGRYGGFDGGGYRKEVGRLAASVGMIAARTARGDSPGSSIVDREAAPRGVRSPAGMVLRPQASAVSKPASNWEGAERGRGCAGQTSKECGGGENSATHTRVMADVGWWRWFVHQEIWKRNGYQSHFGSLSRNHRSGGIRTHHIRQSEDSVGRQGGGGDTD